MWRETLILYFSVLLALTLSKNKTEEIENIATNTTLNNSTLNISSTVEDEIVYFQGYANKYPEKGSYKVAILNYVPLRSYDEEHDYETVLTNALRLKNRILNVAEDKETDIVILPEYAITSIPLRFNVTDYRIQNRDVSDVYTPNGYSDASDYLSKIRHALGNVASKMPLADNNRSLCNDEENWIQMPLQHLACAAERGNVYVVANYFEYENCRERYCPDDEILLYNANVVFDPEGRIIAKYRKQTSYEEPWINLSPLYNGRHTFRTNFNVTFGLLIGDDLMDQEMTEVYLEDKHTTDIVLSTSVISTVPFEHSIQNHAVWAHRLDVNLLVSGYSWEGAGGIYLGRYGPLKNHITDPTTDQAIIELVPMHHTIRNITMLNYYTKDFGNVKRPRYITHEPLDESVDINKFANDLFINSELLDHESQKFHKTLCVEGLCCDFDIIIHMKDHIIKSVTPFYRYRVVVLRSESRSSKNVRTTTEVCAVLACKDKSIDTCGHLFKSSWERKHLISPTVFTSIVITRKANMTDSFFAPIASGNRLYYSRDIDYTYITGKMEETGIFLYLKKPKDDVIAFGINGRYFNVNKTIVHEESMSTFRKIFYSIVAALVIGVVILVVWTIYRHCCKKKKNGDPNRSTIPLHGGSRTSTENTSVSP